MNNQNETEKLQQLLQSNKITYAEFNTLRAAIEKKHVFTDINDCIFLNPYQYLSTQKAFMIGIVLLIVTSFIGGHAYIHYPGIFAFFYIEHENHSNAFILLVKMNMINTATIAIIYFYLADFIKTRGSRFTDFLSFALISRFPYFFATILQFIYVKTVPGFIENCELSMLVSVLNMSFAFFLDWQIITNFFMLKELSGLRGKKLMSCFIFSNVIAYITSISIFKFLLQ